MTRNSNTGPSNRSKTATRPSAVKAVLSWIVETDREFRVAQSMVNDAHDRN